MVQGLTLEFLSILLLNWLRAFIKKVYLHIVGKTMDPDFGIS